MSELAELSLGDLSEPARPARTEMQDAGLEDLARSIHALGVLEPLLVKRTAGGPARFEVVAGHRRLLAARMAGLASVPCLVLPEAAPEQATMVHENLIREELHPLDEALLYADLYERAGDDIEKVAELVQRPLDYVSRRLLLGQLPEPVRAALRADTIALGVAEELGKMSAESDQEWYLQHAIRGGCSVAQMRQWRKEANARREFAASEATREEPGGATNAAESSPASPGTAYLGVAQPHELVSSRETAPCLFCGTVEEQWQMFRKFVCRPCADERLKPIVDELVRRGVRPA